MTNNVVGMFSDENLVDLLETLLEDAKQGKITKSIIIYGNKQSNGYALVGLDTLSDITEAVGNLEMVKTHLTLSLLDDIHQGE